ncbi:MAG TPA: hypothetical protein VFR85_16625 [Anaeromyxobacteraceae bacterium]|nr:hypothetical protein [Anaeromyxobacteraceae bacterium]
MFKPDPSLHFVQVGRDQVVALVESINQPQVSIPGKTSQAVQGYLCGLRNPSGNTFSILVSLFLPKAGETVVYVHDRRQLSLEDYRQAEIEGLQFLESMGFMLDNLNFRNMDPAQQEATLKRIPVFSPPRPLAAQAPAASDARSAAPAPARLARFLASF